MRNDLAAVRNNVTIKITLYGVFWMPLQAILSGTLMCVGEGGQNFNQPLPDCMVCDIYASSGYIIRPRGTNL